MIIIQAINDHDDDYYITNTTTISLLIFIMITIIEGYKY